MNKKDKKYNAYSFTRNNFRLPFTVYRLPQNAFTIAEMLVVLLVLSIVIAAAMPVITKRTKIATAGCLWERTSADLDHITAINTGSIGIGVNPTDAMAAKLIINTSGVDENQILFRQGGTTRGRLIMDSDRNVGLGSVTMLGANATALGYAANASSPSAIALGYNANAYGYLNATTRGAATAIGRDTNAYGYISTALGYAANTYGNYSVTLGRANAYGACAIAIGYTANAYGYDSVGGTSLGNSTAVGYNSNAYGYYSTALGRSSKTGDNYATAVGSPTNASGIYSTVLGYGSNAQGIQSVAIGINNFGALNGHIYGANGSYCVAIGPSSQAADDDTIAVGRGSKAYSASAIALGHGANSNYTNSIAFGSSANAYGYHTDANYLGNSIAIGSYANAYYAFSVAIGANAKTNGNVCSTAIGSYANAGNNSTTALGYFSQAVNMGTTALGAYTNAYSLYSIAIGYEADAYGTNSIALGRDARSSSTDTAGGYPAIALGGGSRANIGSVALGHNANAVGGIFYIAGATAIGQSSIATGCVSTALGYLSNAPNGGSTALGAGAIASGYSSTAVGYGANASVANEIRLGNNDAFVDIGGVRPTICAVSYIDAQPQYTYYYPKLYINGGMYATQYLTGSTGNVHSLSDQKLKKNIRDIPNSYDKLLKLHGVQFEWRHELAKKYGMFMGGKPIHKLGESQDLYTTLTDKHKQYGVIAQEVEKILPDLVYKDKQGLKTDINLIQLITPVTDKKRVSLILEKAGGFVYFVSITGITGTKVADEEKIKTNIKELKNLTDLPVIVGFGIKTPQKARQINSFADGVVVGSAFVNVIEKFVDKNGNVQNNTELLKAAQEFLKSFNGKR